MILVGMEKPTIHIIINLSILFCVAIICKFLEILKLLWYYLLLDIWLKFIFIAIGIFLSLDPDFEKSSSWLFSHVNTSMCSSRKYISDLLIVSFTRWAIESYSDKSMYICFQKSDNFFICTPFSLCGEVFHARLQILVFERQWDTWTKIYTYRIYDINLHLFTNQNPFSHFRLFLIPKCTFWCALIWNILIDSRQSLESLKRKLWNVMK